MSNAREAQTSWSGDAPATPHDRVVLRICGWPEAPLGEVLVDGPRGLTHHQWLTLVPHFAAHRQAYADAYEETFVRRRRRQVAHDNEGRTKEPGR